jgi:hypothetical protein
MNENRFAKFGPAVAVLDAQDERPETGGLLSGCRPSKHAPVAPKRPVKFFADWPANAPASEKPGP